MIESEDKKVALLSSIVLKERGRSVDSDVVDESSLYDSDSTDFDDSHIGGSIAMVNWSKRRRQQEAFDGINFDEIVSSEYFEDGSGDEHSGMDVVERERSVRYSKKSRRSSGNDGGLRLFTDTSSSMGEVPGPMPTPLSPRDIEECRELAEEAGGEPLDTLVSSFIHDLATEEIASRIHSYRGGASMLIYDALRGGSVPLRQCKLLCFGSDELLKAALLNTLFDGEETYALHNSKGDAATAKTDVNNQKLPLIRRGVLKFQGKGTRKYNSFRRTEYSLAYCMADILHRNRTQENTPVSSSTSITPGTSVGNSSPLSVPEYNSDGEENEAQDGCQNTQKDTRVNMSLIRPLNILGVATDGDMSLSDYINSNTYVEKMRGLGRDDKVLHTKLPMNADGSIEVPFPVLERSSLDALYHTIEERLCVPTELVAKFLEDGYFRGEDEVSVTSISINSTCWNSEWLDMLGRDQRAVSLVCFDISKMRIIESRSSRSKVTSEKVSIEMICDWVKKAVQMSSCTLVVGIDSSDFSNRTPAISWGDICDAIRKEISEDQLRKISFFALGDHDMESDPQHDEMFASFRTAVLTTADDRSMLRTLILRDRLRIQAVNILTWPQTVDVARSTGLFFDEVDIRKAIDAMAIAGEVVFVLDEKAREVNFVFPELGNWIRDCFGDSQNFPVERHLGKGKNSSASCVTTTAALRRNAKRGGIRKN